MKEINVMLKPDWVSWESVKDCIVKSHEYNRKRGVVMHNPDMTAQELADYLKEAYCFVALCGEEVVGTCSLKIVNPKCWWTKDRVGYTCVDAVAPGYKGTDAYFDMRALRNKYINDFGLKVLQFDTHEDNKLVQRMSQKRGYKYVRYCAFPMTNYYSVVMVRWLEGCPFSDNYCNFRFKLSKFLTKLVYKPGRIFRFKL